MKPLLLSLIFFGILPFSYGIEPWEVMEYYLGLWQNEKFPAGNVLAYKNKFGQTIF